MYFYEKILWSMHSHWILSISVERYFYCVHTMPKAWRAQSKTLDKALLHELIGQKLIDDPRVSWRRRPRERQGQSGEKYAKELLHLIGKYLYPKITKINDLWLWHRTKNFSITELTMEKCSQYSKSLCGEKQKGNSSEWVPLEIKITSLRYFCGGKCP